MNINRVSITVTAQGYRVEGIHGDPLFESRETAVACFMDMLDAVDRMIAVAKTEGNPGGFTKAALAEFGVSGGSL